MAACKNSLSVDCICIWYSWKELAAADDCWFVAFKEGDEERFGIGDVDDVMGKDWGDVIDDCCCCCCCCSSNCLACAAKTCAKVLAAAAEDCEVVGLETLKNELAIAAATAFKSALVLPEGEVGIPPGKEPSANEDIGGGGNICWMGDGVLTNDEASGDLDEPITLDAGDCVVDDPGDDTADTVEDCLVCYYRIREKKLNFS